MVLTKPLITAATSLAVLTAVLLLRGCHEYPQVSRRAYDLSMALYATCQREDTTRLEKISRLTASGVDARSLTTREADWLNAIIHQARAGNWDDATQECRKLLEDQVH